MRLAGREREALEGALPTLSTFHRVTTVGELDETGRIHFVLHRVIPEYLDRLPAGRDCRAIRELLSWEDEDGQPRSLTTRYHKAAAHLVNAAGDFGRRQEPRLLLECARRFIVLDQEDRLAARPSGPPDAGVLDSEISEPMPSPPLAAEDPGGGIIGVHGSLDYRLFADRMASAQEITILNTWIPELNILADAVLDAIARAADVSILMLYPDSEISRLRSQSLAAGTRPRFREDRVLPGVRHCLDVLAAIARAVDDDARHHLRVRLYDSLPSISVYRVDDQAFVSVFVHGQLAVKSVQIEVQGQDSLLGQLVFREVATLWEIGQEFKDLDQWQAELTQMGRTFGTPR
jgi:hypothetical protein